MWPFKSRWEVELGRHPAPGGLFPEYKYATVRARTSSGAALEAVLKTPGIWSVTGVRRLR